MKRFTMLAFLMAVLVGCNAEPSKPGASAGDKVQANLEKLSPEDRTAAESQVFCPAMEQQKLGGMGVPIKVEVEGETIFVCCQGCVKFVKDNPKQAKDKVAEFKSKASKKG